MPRWGEEASRSIEVLHEGFSAASWWATRPRGKESSDGEWRLDSMDVKRQANGTTNADNYEHDPYSEHNNFQCLK